MFASLSPESRILKLIAKHDLSLAFVAALAKQAGILGCSFQTLSLALNSGRGLRRETAQPLLDLMTELDDFTRLFSPMEMRLENGTKVWEWMTLVRSGEVRIFSLENEQLVERKLPE